MDGTGHGTIHASPGGGADFHFPFFSPLALATLGATAAGRKTDATTKA